MTSYQLSERIDIHSILFYGLALPLYRATVAIENAWRFIRAVLLFWLGILAKVLGLVVIVAGLVAAVAMIPVQFWLCLAGLVVGAYVTYPRTKAAK